MKIDPVVFWTAFGTLVGVVTLTLVASDQIRRFTERRNAAKPPFCLLCGISAHAPKEQTRLACPRNPYGAGHVFEIGAPETLRPPTRAMLERAVFDEAWGETRYRPESAWNDSEARAYLWLHRRDQTESQGFRVTVFNPTSVSSETPTLTMDGRFVALHPDDFLESPALVPGTYRVVWRALVDLDGTPSLEDVARDSFVVPPPS